MGLLSCLPLIYFVYFVGISFTDLPIPQPPYPLLVKLHVLSMLCTFALLVAYFVRIRRSDLDDERKMKLIHGLVWGSVFVFPWFWLEFYARRPE